MVEGVALGVGLGVDLAGDVLEVMGSEEAVWAACSAFSCRSVPACRMAAKKPAGRGRGAGVGVSDLGDSDLGDSHREGRRASLGMGGGTVCGRHCTAFGGWYSSEIGANRVRPAGIGGGGGLVAFCGDFTG